MSRFSCAGSGSVIESLVVSFRTDRYDSSALRPTDNLRVLTCEETATDLDQGFAGPRMSTVQRFGDEVSLSSTRSSWPGVEDSLGLSPANGYRRDFFTVTALPNVVLSELVDAVALPVDGWALYWLTKLVRSCCSRQSWFLRVLSSPSSSRAELLFDSDTS